MKPIYTYSELSTSNELLLAFSYCVWLFTEYVQNNPYRELIQIFGLVDVQTRIRVRTHGQWAND